MVSTLALFAKFIVCFPYYIDISKILDKDRIEFIVCLSQYFQYELLLFFLPQILSAYTKFNISDKEVVRLIKWIKEGNDVI